MRIRSQLIALVFLCTILLHIGSLVFGDTIWWLDLWSHFQLQFAVFMFGLAALSFLYAGNRILGGTLTLYACIPLLWVASTSAYNTPHVSLTPVLIYFQNTLYHQSKEEHTSMASAVAQHPARIYAFVEPHQALVTTLSAILKAKPTIYHSDGGASCAVFVPDTSLTVRNAEVLLSPLHDPLCVVRFDSFDLYVAHPHPPLSEATFIRQNTYFETLRRLIEESQALNRPWVAVGDFNATLFSARFRLYFGAYLQTQHYTWSRNVPLRLPLDHALSDRPLRIVRYPALTSDHAGIGVDFIPSSP